MRIDGKRFQLVLEDDTEQMKSLKKRLPEWQNLSERNWYPENMPDKMSFTIQVNEQVAGVVELVNIRWFNRKAEITIWTLPDFRGQGLGRNALAAIIQFAFEQLNLHRLEAEVYEFNTPARNLFEKTGFVVEGTLREAKYKDGQYFSIIRYGLLKREWRNNSF